jgi:hypothetical protein
MVFVRLLACGGPCLDIPAGPSAVEDRAAVGGSGRDGPMTRSCYRTWLRLQHQFGIKELYLSSQGQPARRKMVHPAPNAVPTSMATPSAAKALPWETLGGHLFSRTGQVSIGLAIWAQSRRHPASHRKSEPPRPRPSSHATAPAVGSVSLLFEFYLSAVHIVVSRPTPARCPNSFVKVCRSAGGSGGANSAAMFSRRCCGLPVPNSTTSTPGSCRTKR